MKVELPPEFDNLLKGSKWVDIRISKDAIWRYKVHEVAVHAASKAFKAEYERLVNDPAVLVAYVKDMDFIELDNAPERQSVLVGDKVVLMNDLLKDAEITVA